MTSDKLTGCDALEWITMNHTHRFLVAEAMENRRHRADSVDCLYVVFV